MHAYRENNTELVKNLLAQFAAYACFALLVLLLTGCVTKPPADSGLVGIRNLPDPVLLVGCEQPAPPLSVEYITKPWDEKERILTEDIRSRIMIIDVCDSRFKALREWRLKALEPR